jgi:8-oxo-dGTP diphosphatase
MRPIRNSTKAVIIQDQQVLLTKNKDDSGFFYLFPGGGQESGETLEEALQRECMEEIGQDVIIQDLIHIREYIGKNHQFAKWDADIHQIEFYFLCQLKESDSHCFNGISPDTYQVAVEWTSLDQLENIRVFPKTLGDILVTQNKAKVYLGDVN